MSYTIEYDRQFIKSELGITPLWLCGDSNVTTGRGRYERRDRHWSVFLSMLACTKEELLAAVERMKGGYGEHWKKGGKWVDDAGITRWVENGCKAAATVEAIIEENNMTSIHCCLHDWSGEWSKKTNETRVSTTAEFDAWLQEVKPLLQKGKVFPVVTLSYDSPIKHPSQKPKDENELVCIKRKSNYLTKLEFDDKGDCIRSSWSPKISDEVMVMTRAEAESLVRPGSCRLVGDAKIVSAEVLKNPNNIVLALSGKGMDGRYVVGISRSALRYTVTLNTARRYTTYASAKKAAENIMKKFPDVKVGVLSV